MISVFPKLTKPDPDPTPVSLAEIAARIKSTLWRDVTQQLRALQGEEFHQLKKSLPGCTFAGVFTRRANDALVSASGLRAFDLDEIDDAPALVDMLRSCPVCALAYVSPSGRGVKAVLRIDDATSDDAWERGRDYLEAWGSITPQGGQQDVARLSFLCMDAGAHFAADGPSIPRRQPTEIPSRIPEYSRQAADHVIPAGGDLRPGDDYSLRGDLFGLLRAHGWQTQLDEHTWTRPGKKRGVSATWDRVQEYPRTLYVFTTSTPLPPMTVLSPFAVYAHLEHGGDFGAAAKALAAQGYGSGRAAKPAEREYPLPDYALAPFENGGTMTEVGAESHKPLLASLSEAKRMQEDRDRRANRDALMIRLSARAYDHAHPPPDAQPRYRMGGVTVATAGNLTVISAQAKAGKSACIAGLMAATLRHEDQRDKEEIDCLGWEAHNPAGLALVHIDTEQAIQDYDGLIRRRTLHRAGLRDGPPAWFLSYCLTGWDAASIAGALPALLDHAHRQYGGIYAVVVDGWADLISDPNDQAESNSAVARYQGLAIEYDTAIIGALHLNPGSDAKTRGHLGSQLERKAETVLSLAHKDGVTRVVTQRSRGAPILPQHRVAFRWDDQARMHVSCGHEVGAVELTRRQQAKRDEHRDLAECAFHRMGEGVTMGRIHEFLDALAAVLEARGQKSTQDAAYGRYRSMKDWQIVGLYPPDGANQIHCELLPQKGKAGEG